MIPLRDESATVRFPVMTLLIILVLFTFWIVVQGGGFNDLELVTSICNLGMVPGELTHMAPLGSGIPLTRTLSCMIDDNPINYLTPLISMFLHGGWLHLLGNVLFLWVFGRNIEDVTGRMRFLGFYLVCGLIAAAAQIAVTPASPVPTVGASGAISGVMGAYLVLYPRVRIRMLFWFLIFFKIFSVPAWLVLLYWFGLQLLSGLPQLHMPGADVTGGVAVWAHIGGFAAGMLLIPLFRNPELARRRVMALAGRQ